VRKHFRKEESGCDVDKGAMEHINIKVDTVVKSTKKMKTQQIG
jgi:hypothetical protein